MCSILCQLFDVFFLVNAQEIAVLLTGVLYDLVKFWLVEKGDVLFGTVRLIELEQFERHLVRLLIDHLAFLGHDLF